MNASVNASLPSCIHVFSAHGSNAVLHLSKEKKTSKSLEVEKSLRQKKMLVEKSDEKREPDGVIPLCRGIEGSFFWALPFFLAPNIGAFFIFSGVGTSNDVRCGVLSADGDARIHRCRQYCAAQGVAPTQLKFFFI